MKLYKDAYAAGNRTQSRGDSYNKSFNNKSGGYKKDGYRKDGYNKQHNKKGGYNKNMHPDKHHEQNPVSKKTLWQKIKGLFGKK